MIFVLVVASILLIEEMTSHAQLDEARIREVEELIIIEPNDTAGSLESLTNAQLIERQKSADEKEQRRLKEIKNRPELTPYILAILDRRSDIGDWGGVAQTLQALSMRDDLPTARFVQIKTKVREILGRGVVPIDNFEQGYLLGGVDVLATQPGDENEDLIIQTMELMNDANGLRLKRAAADALTRIGTARCLPSLVRARDWVAEFTRDSEEAKYVNPEMDAAVNAVKDRLNASTQAGKQQGENRWLQSAATAKSDTPNLNHPAFPQAADDARSVALRRLVWALIMAAVMGLIWMALKRRK